LGLATSYQIIVENHKGQLDCFAGTDRTEFRITIPANKI
jgi:nitrogen-specific signal transduction histidine kinase